LWFVKAIVYGFGMILKDLYTDLFDCHFECVGSPITGDSEKLEFAFS